jgi:alanyl-tRNA synthetase
VTTDKIRQAFLEYFKSNGHTVVPSDSLVPKDDPTLLFTGAGMNQFKEKFLGRNVTYKRATTSQKCLRTGDLENVGRTSGHHTFFEMLGNFSFGDYFKKEAIVWAWEFLVERLQLAADRLWVSVYREDKEAYDIWKDVIKIPPGKIIKFGEKENFWPSEAPTKGPNGPCGPCSEIYYDYGKDAGCKKPGCTPACDCGRFVEVWNLVFTQFDRQPDGSLKPLPSKNIDTGMGLERLASVMQGVRTNFETDIFEPIIKQIEKGLRVTGYGVRAKVNAIADHIRAVTFMIADGVMPSNEERGYVARKLIRRSMSHAQDIGISGPFLYKLVAVISDVMSDPYPELKARRDDIAQIIKREEQAFISVIAAQMPKAEEVFKSMKAGAADKIAEAAFNFYDTYGMPYDLLEDIAQKNGVRIDRDKFEALLERQRSLSRSRTKIKGEIFTETFAKKVEALGLITDFLGYEKFDAVSNVLAVMDGGEVILDSTPFYGESGGQVGDWGTIETDSGAMEVEDAKRIGHTIVHIGRMIRGSVIKKGEKARVRIDGATRTRVMANHTATHLLHSALRKVLGDHVRQMGSLVDAEHLRFDFTHMKKLEERELQRVEQIVNDDINKALGVSKEIKDIGSARKEGAIALFAEKYEDKVRVVSIEGVSKELCGGTHVDNTKDIGLFKIVSESSIASGVRRIEALTGGAASAWIRQRESALLAKQDAEKLKDIQKRALEERFNKVAGDVERFVGSAVSAGGSKLIAEIVDGLGMEGLRRLSDRIRDKEPASVVILAERQDDKASFIVSVSEKSAAKGIAAGDIARTLAGLIDGSGGGKAGFAQGGGRAPGKLEEALAKVIGILKEKLK